MEEQNQIVLAAAADGVKKKVKFSDDESSVIQYGHRMYHLIGKGKYQKWRWILNRYKAVFHEKRNSVDIKDRYRNMEIAGEIKPLYPEHYVPPAILSSLSSQAIQNDIDDLQNEDYGFDILRQEAEEMITQLAQLQELAAQREAEQVVPPQEVNDQHHPQLQGEEVNIQQVLVENQQAASNAVLVENQQVPPVADEVVNSEQVLVENQQAASNSVLVENQQVPPVADDEEVAPDAVLVENQQVPPDALAAQNDAEAVQPMAAEQAATLRSLVPELLKLQDPMVGIIGSSFANLNKKTSQIPEMSMIVLSLESMHAVFEHFFTDQRDAEKLLQPLSKAQADEIIAKLRNEHEAVVEMAGDFFKAQESLLSDLQTGASDGLGSTISFVKYGLTGCKAGLMKHLNHQKNLLDGMFA